NPGWSRGCGRRHHPRSAAPRSPARRRRSACCAGRVEACPSADNSVTSANADRLAVALTFRASSDEALDFHRLGGVADEVVPIALLDPFLGFTLLAVTVGARVRWLRRVVEVGLRHDPSHGEELVVGADALA